MAEDAPDYAGIVARAAAGEYVHMVPPVPPKELTYGVLDHADWPFGRSFERYLELKGITIPLNAKSISLRYDADQSCVRVTIKRVHGKKQRHFISPPLIDNMEATDT